MTTGVTQEISQPFRPRARMLQLLGNELIASDRLEVFELVKNAYDADASHVTVRMDLERPVGPMITVRDDGTSMTLDEIRSVWLVPGDDHRKQQRASRKRTPHHHRLPLGEKDRGLRLASSLIAGVRAATPTLPSLLQCDLPAKSSQFSFIRPHYGS